MIYTDMNPRKPDGLAKLDWSQELRNAIIIQAANDWRDECKKVRTGKPYSFKSLRRFFTGEYLQVNTLFERGFKLLEKERRDAMWDRLKLCELTGADFSNSKTQYRLFLSRYHGQKQYLCNVTCAGPFELEEKKKLYTALGYTVEKTEEVVRSEAV